VLENLVTAITRLPKVKVAAVERFRLLPPGHREIGHRPGKWAVPDIAADTIKQNYTDFRRARKPHQSAFAPWIVQLVGALAMTCAETTCVPFMNQIATSPAVSRHRMSL
jgi:hypothetical protein